NELDQSTKIRVWLMPRARDAPMSTRCSCIIGGLDQVMSWVGDARARGRPVVQPPSVVGALGWRIWLGGCPTRASDPIRSWSKNMAERRPHTQSRRSRHMGLMEIRPGRDSAGELCLLSEHQGEMLVRCSDKRASSAGHYSWRLGGSLVSRWSVPQAMTG